jgi:hypothetical protein
LGKIRDIGADSRLLLLSVGMITFGSASIGLGSSQISPKLPFMRRRGFKQRL